MVWGWGVSAYVKRAIFLVKVESEEIASNCDPHTVQYWIAGRCR